jgi:hypothetical protein
MKRLLIYFQLFSSCVLFGQDPIGLQVDSNLTVLFGKDTAGFGKKMMWLPSKGSAFIGDMFYLPYDSIGELTFSFGRSMASAIGAVAMGQSLAQGNFATALNNSSAPGNLSLATGFSTSFGDLSTALGNSIAAGYAAIAGGGASTNADLATAFGLSRSESLLCTTIGRYNVGGGNGSEYIATDPIFEVGIGSHNQDRRNALTIRKDGFISLGNHLAHTKFALYETVGATYGMGVVAGQFRFNIGNPQARYAFFNQPGDNATEIFTIHGSGVVNTGGSLHVNGNITYTGTIGQVSDRNRKEEISEVNYQQILQKLSQLQISEWRYRGDDARHLGPMAQDFSASFGLGDTDTSIATVDADGVALAAIKALIVEVERLKMEIAELKRSR